MIELLCKNCGVKFKRYPFVLKSGRGKFCSNKCKNEGMDMLRLGTHPNSLKNLKKMTSQRAKELGFGKWMKGRILPERTKKKIGASLKGGNSTSFKEGNHYYPDNEFIKTGRSFKGTEKEYHSLHYQMRKKLGKPSECVYCGNMENLGWANVSGEYYTDLSDWISLCGRCHFYFDAKKGVHMRQSRKKYEYNRIYSRKG